MPRYVAQRLILLAVTLIGVAAGTLIPRRAQWSPPVQTMPGFHPTGEAVAVAENKAGGRRDTHLLDPQHREFE